MLQPRRIAVDSYERQINQKNNTNKMKISTISKSSVCKTLSTSMNDTRKCRQNLDRKNVADQLGATSTVRRFDLPKLHESSSASAVLSFRFTSTYNIATYILLAVILYSSTLCVAQLSGKYHNHTHSSHSKSNNGIIFIFFIFF